MKGTRMYVDALMNELAPLRSRLAEEGCVSWTSEGYQNQVLDHLLAHAGQGRGVIEVGVYKGGLSAQLIYICQRLGWPYYGIDIEPAVLDTIMGLLPKLNLSPALTTFFCGTLSDFAQYVYLPARPAAVVIDGDHALAAVVRDIQSLYHLNARPHAAIFHDFSLRHPTTGEAVDQAIWQSFGRGVRIERIGTQYDASTRGPTKNNPQPDGHYWEVPGSEGAILTLPDRLAQP